MDKMIKEMVEDKKFHNKANKKAKVVKKPKHKEFRVSSQSKPLDYMEEE